MANDEHLQILLTAISSGDWSPWQRWREANPGLAPDLKSANLQSMDLRGADLAHADLKYARLQRADLSGADLSSADLRFTELRGANFANARLSGAMVDPAALRFAINAKMDFKQAKSSAWIPHRSRERKIRRTGILERLGGLFQSCRSRLSKLAPGLFEHEEVVTLGLSKREAPKKDQHTANGTPSGSPAEPDEQSR